MLLDDQRRTSVRAAAKIFFNLCGVGTALAAVGVSLRDIVGVVEWYRYFIWAGIAACVLGLCLLIGVLIKRWHGRRTGREL